MRARRVRSTFAADETPQPLRMAFALARILGRIAAWSERPTRRLRDWVHRLFGNCISPHFHSHTMTVCNTDLWTTISFKYYLQYYCLGTLITLVWGDGIFSYPTLNRHFCIHNIFRSTKILMQYWNSGITGTLYR